MSRFVRNGSRRTVARARILAHVVAVAVAALVDPGAPAHADVRIWEADTSPEDAAEYYVDLDAFLQPGFVVRRTGGDPNATVPYGGPVLQRARLGLKAGLAPRVRLRLELETAGGPSVQDAYVDWQLADALSVRAGQMKVPFLRAAQFGDVGLRFLDRPLYLPQSPDRATLRYLNARDVGLLAHGRVGDGAPEARGPVLRYGAGLFLGGGPNRARNDDRAYLLAARVELHPLGLPASLDAEGDLARHRSPKPALGVGAYSNCDDRANWNRGLTADGELRWQGLYASASVLWMRSDPGGGLAHALGVGGSPRRCEAELPEGVTPLPRYVSRAAHAQAQYVLPADLLAIGDHAFEVGVRADWIDPASPYDSASPILGGDEASAGYVAPPSFGDAENPPTEWRLTFGLTWFPTGEQRLRLQANYQVRRETETVVTVDGPVDGVANDLVWVQATAGF